MVDPDIPKYAALLKSLYIFRELDDAQIAHLVSRLRRVEVPVDVPVILEGETENDFYIIYIGKIEASQQDDEGEHRLYSLGPGDYFGEESLFLGQPSSVTITAKLKPVTLLRVERNDFFDLIQGFPYIKDDLLATQESRRLALEKQFDWLGSDEAVYFLTRKHPFFLFRALIIPAVIGFISLLGLGYGLMQPRAAFSDLAVILGGVGMALSIFLSIWDWIDWGNDYYILTDQKVVWLERVVIFYYSRREAPLTQILDIGVDSSWFGRILGYGNVEVRTFTTSIKMRNANHPNRLASFIDGFQTRSRVLRKKFESEDLKHALSQRLNTDSMDEQVIDISANSQKPVEHASPRTSVIQQIMSTFLQVRFIEGSVITYRKHWLLLLRKIFLPVLSFVLFSLLVAFLVRSGVFSGTCFPGLYGLVYLGIFLWLVYNYLDWSNDIYQLTPDQIFDIERKPLGEEIKKSAPLESILSLEHTREGILQILLNYGNVIIMVGQTSFVFRGVKNPDSVQQEINSHIEELKLKKQRSTEASERERMLDWFSTYHRETETFEETEKKSDWPLFPG